MQIGFDFDGVIAATQDVICEVASEVLNREIKLTDINHYCLKKSFNITDKVAKIIVDEILSYINTVKVKPISGAIEFIKKWFEKDNEIIIITTRLNEEFIYPFLEEYLPRIPICVHTSQDKGTLARKLGISHFIDDYWSNLVALANSGIYPILYTQPWNLNISSRSLMFTQVGERIYSWEEMKKYL